MSITIPDIPTDDLYDLRLACTWASAYWENKAETETDDDERATYERIAQGYGRLWFVVDSLLAERFPA